MISKKVWILAVSNYERNDRMLFRNYQLWPEQIDEYLHDPTRTHGRQLPVLVALMPEDSLFDSAALC